LRFIRCGIPAPARRSTEIAGRLQIGVDGLSEVATEMQEVIAATGGPRLRHALDEISAALADSRSSRGRAATRWARATSSAR
jgi:hypothetical protein